ncbi:MAG: hypothetical protein IT395_03350 [Candidatus Omnitrophica bacterium]|nr:hypothetical protein [Candidatus Omnitrophota bacterium]
MGQFKDLVSKLHSDYQTALSKDDENGYVRLSHIVDVVADSLREYAQELTAQEIKLLAHKLKGSEPLTAKEIETLRLCIVGDADSYVNIENSVPEWKKELSRVMAEISGYSSEEPKVGDVLKLQALLRDADRVIDDLGFYAAQKDRVAKFDSAVQHLTQEDRGLLFGLLNTKLQSKNY